MKVTTEQNNKQQEIKYPFIGINRLNHRIVVFTDILNGEARGLCIKDPTLTSLAGCFKSWRIIEFKPYNGKITLEND